MSSGLEEFAAAYMEAAVFTEGGPDNPEVDEAEWTVTAITIIEEGCKAFLEANKGDIGGRYDMAGHDFWLTRNGHGAGFWDGDWPEEAGERLTEAAEKTGYMELYVGDDGFIYIC